jgi:acyl dehydratase
MMRFIAAGLLTLTAATGVATAQKPPFKLPAGRLYVFHSGPRSGCPGVDWYIVAEVGDTLTGFIAWNNMQSLARATGTLNRRTGTFEMTAHEIEGQDRTVTVTGTVSPTSGWLTADVQGQDVSCRGIKVPWFTPPPS